MLVMDLQMDLQIYVILGAKRRGKRHKKRRKRPNMTRKEGDLTREGTKIPIYNILSRSYLRE